MMKSMVEEVRKKKNLSQMIQLNVSFFGKITDIHTLVVVKLLRMNQNLLPIPVYSWFSYW